MIMEGTTDQERHSAHSVEPQLIRECPFHRDYEIVNSYNSKSTSTQSVQISSTNALRRSQIDG